MRIVKIILAFLLVCVIGFCLLIYLYPDGFAYGRFKRQTSNYYSQLARACDSLLQQNKNFSKRAATASQNLNGVWMDSSNVLWNDVRISGADPSLPKQISSLHANKVFIEPNRVLIEFGVRPDWVVIWGQSDTQTNTWTLVTNGEGSETILYSERR
jgi:hypothetical protein